MTVRGFRFSVAGLFGLVAFVAIGVTALANPNALWASTLLTGTVIALLIAGLASVFRDGASRAFGLEYFLSGVAYWLVIFGPGLSNSVCPYLLTTKSLVYAHATWHHPPAVQTAALSFTPDGRTLAFASDDGTIKLWNTGRTTNTPNVNTSAFIAAPTTPFEAFLRVDQSLWTLLFGIIGGLLGRYFYATRPTDLSD